MIVGDFNLPGLNLNTHCSAGPIDSIAMRIHNLLTDLNLTEHTKVRASKLRGKPETELQKQLGELKTELGNLRLYRVTRGTSYHGKLKKIRTFRKSIARVYTVIHQAQKLRQREAYRSKRYVPKDLRPKKTRAIRRRLSKREQAIHTVRSIRKARSYPARVYAVKC